MGESLANLNCDGVFLVKKLSLAMTGTSKMLAIGFCFGGATVLEARNLPSAEGGFHLTDGRMTMTIVPWKISSFNGAGIEQPGMDHIGFRVSDLKAFTANVDKVAKTNIHFAPKPLDFDSEGTVRLALLKKCPHGTIQLADPDGTLIDVAEDHQ